MATSATSPAPHSAAERIRAEIGDGAISFERFMQLALYGEGGFYATRGAAGRRGDFLTSPEVGPLFGAVMARMIDDEWRRQDRPARFTVVDAGAGPATLLRSIRAAEPECAANLDYVAVEISAAQRVGHPSWVRSMATMPEIECGVIIANELLDNLPFRLFVMDGGWREAHVVIDRDGAFAEVLAAVDTVGLALPAVAEHGARVPIQRLAGAWAADALARCRRGRLVVIDYAVATTAGCAVRPWRSWLRTYRSHQPGEHYLRHPGLQDITTDVVVEQLLDAVGDADAVRTQAQFLGRWGIDALVDEGRRIWAERSGTADLRAMTMRSRVREAEALCDPSGLGSFMIVEFSR